MKIKDRVELWKLMLAEWLLEKMAKHYRMTVPAQDPKNLYPMMDDETYARRILAVKQNYTSETVKGVYMSFLKEDHKKFKELSRPDRRKQGVIVSRGLRDGSLIYRYFGGVQVLMKNGNYESPSNKSGDTEDQPKQ